MHALSFRYGQRHRRARCRGRARRRRARRGRPRDRRHRPAARSAAPRSRPTSTCRRTARPRRWRRHPDHLRPGPQHHLPLARPRVGRDARRRRHLHRRQRPRLQRLPRLPAGVHRGVRADGNLATKAGVEGRERFAIHAPLIDSPRPRSSARGSGSASTTGSRIAATTRTRRRPAAMRLLPLRRKGSTRPASRTRPVPSAQRRMTYPVRNPLHAAGRGRQRRPAGSLLPVHGCNLWTGREHDRH